MNHKTCRLLETFIVSTAELSALTGAPMITLRKHEQQVKEDAYEVLEMSLQGAALFCGGKRLDCECNGNG